MIIKASFPFCAFLVLATFAIVGCEQNPSTSSNGGNGGQGGAQTASSSSSSSSTSSSTSGSSSGAGGSAPNCQDYPLCEDFEGVEAGGPPDPTTWQVVSPNCSGTGTITVDDTVSKSGAKSLRVDGKGGYCNHVFVVNSSAVPTFGNAFHGRFFVRLGAPQGDGHTTFLTMRDSVQSKDLRMGGQSKILMWNRESDDATLPSLSPTGISMSVLLTAQQWRCVEFHVDGNAGTIRTWVDGTEIAGLVVDGTPTADVDQAWINQNPGWKPNFADFKLGWEDYAGQDMTLWFDDVALASVPIGCQ